MPEAVHFMEFIHILNGLSRAVPGKHRPTIVSHISVSPISAVLMVVPTQKLPHPLAQHFINVYRDLHTLTSSLIRLKSPFNTIGCKPLISSAWGNPGIGFSRKMG